MDSSNAVQIHTWQHEQAHKVCSHLTDTLLAKKTGVWRQDYFCCKTTSFGTKTIPQDYIKTAFEDLGVTESSIDKRGLCIYFPGGLNGMKSSLSGNPYLVHGESVESVDSGNCIVNLVVKSIYVLGCSELMFELSVIP